MTGIKYNVKCVLQVPLYLNSESRYLYVKEKYQSNIFVKAQVSRTWDNDSEFRGIKFGFIISLLNCVWLKIS